MRQTLIEFLTWFAGNEDMSNGEDLEKIIDIYLSDEASGKAVLNITIVTHSNLELGRNVIDAEQNKGTIINIDDLHNVEIDFEGGGKMSACFVDGCAEYKKDLEIIPIYYYG